MSGVYQSYSELDRDFPDTSVIISDYIGCVALTENGSNCDLSLISLGTSRDIDCNDFCLNNVDKWIEKILFDPLYDSKGNTIVLNQCNIYFDSINYRFTENYNMRPVANLYENPEAYNSRRNSISLIYHKFDKLGLPTGSYSYMNNGVQFYLDNFVSFKEFLSNLLDVHPILYIELEYILDGRSDSRSDNYNDNDIGDLITFYTDYNCTKPIELKYNTDLDSSNFIYIHFDKTITASNFKLI